MDKMRNGIATNVSARMAPGVEYGRRRPSQLYRYRPAMPLRPKASNRAKPPTTGGNTTGRVVTALNSERPGKSRRACTQANGNPSTVEMAVADSEHTNDNRNAVRTSGALTNTQAVRHGARITSPRSGTTNKAAPITASTTTTHGG